MHQEHHHRPRTEVMLHGLEQIPRKEIEYRDTAFTGMDVDAVLARRPQVALVDELAHTNVPGSRNAKRRQDVEELLAAGIDVISTVNIQHPESLGDVVESITYGPTPATPNEQQPWRTSCTPTTTTAATPHSAATHRSAA
ncbi:Sensor protein KdpD [Streptomyces leeuwenhoekii]|uniref:Sensor protein KdpD n=1 Tax=Streptomyces leeuwenhoekii TaxID=1437453 RepID=A0A0F7W7P4_STRLW|nr:Sensor protein KdpD [Streptomyces leeuwenhoekii]